MLYDYTRPQVRPEIVDEQYMAQLYRPANLQVARGWERDIHMLAAEVVNLVVNKMSTDRSEIWIYLWNALSSSRYDNSVMDDAVIAASKCVDYGNRTGRGDIASGIYSSIPILTDILLKKDPDVDRLLTNEQYEMVVASRDFMREIERPTGGRFDPSFREPSRQRVDSRSSYARDDRRSPVREDRFGRQERYSPRNNPREESVHDYVGTKPAPVREREVPREHQPAPEREERVVPRQADNQPKPIYKELEMLMSEHVTRMKATPTTRVHEKIAEETSAMYEAVKETNSLFGPADELLGGSDIGIEEHIDMSVEMFLTSRRIDLLKTNKRVVLSNLVKPRLFVTRADARQLRNLVTALFPEKVTMNSISAAVEQAIEEANKPDRRSLAEGIYSLVTEVDALLTKRVNHYLVGNLSLTGDNKVEIDSAIDEWDQLLEVLSQGLGQKYVRAMQTWETDILPLVVRHLSDELLNKFLADTCAIDPVLHNNIFSICEDVTTAVIDYNSVELGLTGLDDVALIPAKYKSLNQVGNTLLKEFPGSLCYIVTNDGTWYSLSRASLAGPDDLTIVEVAEEVV